VDVEEYKNTLVQCFSNFFVCGTLSHAEIYHGTPTPVYELTIQEK
jgi:hypothetical protein